MTRHLLAVLSCLVIAGTATLPVYADDATGNAVFDGLAFTTARLAKFSVGFTAGLPIAMVRKTLRVTSDTTKKVTNDSDNNALTIGAEALLLPFGAVVGSLEGVSWAASNSWKNSPHDKPFDKELFSLGELED